MKQLKVGVRRDKALPKPAGNGVITQAKVGLAADPKTTNKNAVVKADRDGFRDTELNGLFTELRGDAATLSQVAQSVDGLATIFGTARSKPVPGENGFADYVWSADLGRELRKAGYSLSTGGGPGGMEAPMRGFVEADAELDMKAGRKVGWTTDEPVTVGANIILPKEQGANIFISKEHLKSFKRFLFRMEFLFRDNAKVAEDPMLAKKMNEIASAAAKARNAYDNAKTDKARNKALAGLDVAMTKINNFILKDIKPHNSPKIASPGGFGTVAEIFTYIAMKSHGQATEPVAYGSHDDFFKRHNAAFAPFMNERELPDLANIYTDAKEMVVALKKMKPNENPVDPTAVVPRMVDDLEKGLTKLDGKPKAISFFGGMGDRTKAVAGEIEEIAAQLTSQGATIRVGGSPIGDEAVLRGVARSTKPDTDIQAFAMADAPVQSHGKLDYTRVTDVLVMRELMDTNVSGMVVSPEGAKQIALLFTAACDVQTGKMPRIPIVVLDPDGKFEHLKAELEALMLTDDRKYINKEDLDIVRTAKTAKEAMEILNGLPAAPAAN